MSTPEEQLAGFRAEIDAIDETITQLLLQRCGIVRQVGALKDQHWPSACHIRPAREGQMHRAIAERFAGTDIPPAIAIAIWRLLIGASTQLESALNVVTLARHGHHAWLAREYFGLQSGLAVEQSIADALDAIGAKTSNILLLPTPDADGGDWWRDAALFTTHGLQIFASLPAVSAPLPHGVAPALALAPLSAEPSGDDITYLAVTTREAMGELALQALLSAHITSADDRHHLLQIDGYLAPDGTEIAALKTGLGANLLSCIYLGAHPRAVTITE